MDELPFKAAFGVWGSYVCLIINILALMGQFYVALYPVGGPNLNPTVFFQDYLAGPFLLVQYLMWKIYSWFYRPEDRPLYVKIKNIDIYTGMREQQLSISGVGVTDEQRRQSMAEFNASKPKGGAMGYAKRIMGNLF